MSQTMLRLVEHQIMHLEFRDLILNSNFSYIFNFLEGGGVLFVSFRLYFGWMSETKNYKYNDFKIFWAIQIFSKKLEKVEHFSPKLCTWHADLITHT